MPDKKTEKEKSLYEKVADALSGLYPTGNEQRVSTESAQSGTINRESRKQLAELEKDERRRPR